MSILRVDTNEQNAATAFSKQSSVFDELYSKNTIVQYVISKWNCFAEWMLEFQRQTMNWWC